VKKYQGRNENVRLDHLLLKKEDGRERKPLIVVHGFLSSKTSFKPLFDQQDILEKRDCYLIDLRNSEYSDWHDENSYELYAADIIRWADKQGIWKFDMFGHSMGGKLVQVMTCLYPDRVNAVISLDGAPVK
jgi:pimeloyl-ACP methyl ester carboxylesterase